MIKVTAEDLSSLSGQVNSGAQSISDQLATLMARVNDLVGSGWEGAASGQFNTLYTEWNTSAGQLNKALEGISQLLANAAQAYTQTEEQIAKSMQG